MSGKMCIHCIPSFFSQFLLACSNVKVGGIAQRQEAWLRCAIHAPWRKVLPAATRQSMSAPGETGSSQSTSVMRNFTPRQFQHLPRASKRPIFAVLFKSAGVDLVWIANGFPR